MICCEVYWKDILEEIRDDVFDCLFKFGLFLWWCKDFVLKCKGWIV